MVESQWHTTGDRRGAGRAREAGVRAVAGEFVHSILTNAAIVARAVVALVDIRLADDPIVAGRAHTKKPAGLIRALTAVKAAPGGAVGDIDNRDDHRLRARKARRTIVGGSHNHRDGLLPLKVQ